MDATTPATEPVPTNFTVTVPISLTASIVTLCICTYLFLIKKGLVSAPWMRLGVVRWFLSLSPEPEEEQDDDATKVQSDLEAQGNQTKAPTSGSRESASVTSVKPSAPATSKKFPPGVKAAQPSATILNNPNSTLPIIDLGSEEEVGGDNFDVSETTDEYYLSTGYFAAMMRLEKDKSEPNTNVESEMIDPEKGQLFLDSYFKEVQRMNENETHKTTTLLKDKHRKLIYKDTASSIDPYMKLWKCAWCDKELSLEALFSNASKKGRLWICQNRTDIWGERLGRGKLCHSQTSEPMSLTVIPMATVEVNKRTLGSRVIATYPDIYSLLKRMAIWGDEVRQNRFYRTTATAVTTQANSSDSDGSGEEDDMAEEDDSGNLVYNVATAYFTWIFPWTNDGDIDWVKKSRQKLTLPPRIEELIEYYEKKPSKGKVGSFPGARWVSQDGIGNTVPLETYFLPFTVITTDIIM